MKLLQKGMVILMPLLIGLCCSINLTAQQNNRAISQEEKLQVLNKAFTLLNDNYIFPEVVKPMEKTIRKKFEAGNYSGFITARDFIKNLNHDLETLGNDRHLNIFYDPVRVKQIIAEEKSRDDNPTFDPEFLARAKFENNMVRKTERLDGNVGYLRLDLFLDIRISKPTVVAAMDFLFNSDALIIDLRKNGGGNASTVNFLLNYFIPDSTLTSQFTSRKTKTTTNIYTEHDPLIKKISSDVPLYILVSKRTSSAAEAFAYTLQAFKRAIIVGDTTNGEANPGYAFIVNSDMIMMVPTSINRNVITRTNWQGVGVIPDVAIKTVVALDAAQGAAYGNLRKSAKDKELVQMYEWLAAGFNAKANPVLVAEKELQLFTGTYQNNRVIGLDQSTLYYERTGMSPKKKLLPITHDTFELEGSPFFRVRFIKNDKGQTIALEGMYDDGEKEISKKL